MIKLNIDKQLKEKNMTVYALWKHFDTINYAQFQRLINGETCSIQFKHLDTLCEVLECSIDSLFLKEDKELLSKRIVDMNAGRNCSVHELIEED